MMDAERARIAEIKANARERLLAIPGVTGLDVDYKTVGGRRTDRLAIVVFVERKLPDARDIPPSIDGVPTDVVEGRFDLRADRGRYNPVKCGSSCYPRRFAGDHGTLGCVVRDNATGLPGFLSCFHVMCITQDWKQQDVAITQPAIKLGGSPNDVVGQVIRGAFLGLDGVTRSVDCAFCSAITRSGTVGRTARPPNGYLIAIDAYKNPDRLRGSTAAVVGQRVGKCGASTGFTSGVVASTTFDLSIATPFGQRTFTNQIRIDADAPPFSAYGDSGAAIFELANRTVVGLFFAGNDSVAVAQPIASVCAALNVTVPAAYPVWYVESADVDNVVLQGGNVVPRGNIFFPAPVAGGSADPSQGWDLGDEVLRNVGLNASMARDDARAWSAPFLSFNPSRWSYDSVRAQTNALDYAFMIHPGPPIRWEYGRLRGVYDPSQPSSQWRVDCVPRPETPAPGDTWEFRFHSWVNIGDD
jgi:hypothetical protein